MSLRLDNIIAVGLVVAVCFTALAHGAVEGWSVAVFILLIALLFLLWGVKSLIDGQVSIKIPRPAFPLIGLFVLGSLQSVTLADNGTVKSLSLDAEATRLTIAILSALLVAFFIGANFITKRERLHAFSNFLSVYGLAIAIFAMLQYFTWNGRFYWLRPTLSAISLPFGPFVNHNHFAGYIELLVSIPVALIVVRGVRKEERAFYGFVAAMMALALIVSLSRGGMVSLLAELMFVVVLSRQLPALAKQKLSGVRSRFVQAGALLALVGTITAGVIWIGADPVVNRIAGSDQETFFSSRGWIWRDTWRVIAMHPILGSGLGAFQTVYPNHSQYDGSLGVVAQAHNDYLQALADGGIITLGLVIWFIVLVSLDLRCALRSSDPFLAGLALGCGAGIFGIMVHSLFDFNLQLPSNSLLFLLLVSIISTCRRLAFSQGSEVEILPRTKFRAPSFTIGASR